MTNKLEQAMEVFMRWQETAPRSTPEELLEGHPELDAYLRAILFPGEIEDEEPESEDGPAAVVDEQGGSRTFGEYKLIRELGRGGMGVVHEAWQTSLGRPVALKILAPHLTHDPATLVRFRREASTAGRLQHPGIAQVLEFGTAGDSHYLAMQLIRGVSWEVLLKSLHGRPLSEARGENILAAIERHSTEAGAKTSSGKGPSTSHTDSADAAMTWSGGYVQTVVNIVIQVAETLEYAHNEGVIHRDVKPSNILIQANGRAVLVDFGLAREEGLSSLTMTGDFAGSPYYVSPEQGARQSSELDRRTDLFSLGITLYEALTLHRPFEGSSPHEIIDRILHAEPTPPNKWNSSLAPDLVAVVLKALEKPPHRRYQTAGDFAQDLRAFLALRPVTARLPTRLMRLGRWIRREPLKAVLGSTVAVVLVLLAYVMISEAATRTGREALKRRQVDEWLVDAWFSAQNSETEPAKKHFLDVLELDPGNPVAIFGYVWTARMSREKSIAFLDVQAVPGRADDAIETIRGRYRTKAEHDAAQPIPDDEELRRLDSLRIFILALRRMPALGDAGSKSAFEESLDLIEAAIYSSAKPRFEHFMMMAFVASRLGDAKRARLCANAIVNHWPDFAASHVTAGVALTFTDSDRAVASFRKAISLRPDFFSAHVNLALALGSQGKIDDALAAAKRGARLRPENPDIQNICSMYLTRKAMKLDDPTDAAKRQALLDEAVVRARRSVDIEPSNPRNLMQLAAAVERAGDPDEAWEIVQQIVQIAPRLSRGHRSLLGMARIRGDLAARRAERERWVKVNPNGPTAHREWAEFLLEHGDGTADLDLAFTAIRRADRLTKGRDAFILLTLADVLHRRGERETIPKILSRAEQFLPDDPGQRRDATARIQELRRR